MTTATPGLNSPDHDPVVVAHRHTMNGQDIVITHGMRAVDDVDIPGLLAIANSARAAWDTNVMPRMSASMRHVETVARKLEHGILQSPDAAVSASSQSGSEQGTPAPMQVCAVVKLLTARSGRHYRGRMFVGPIQQSSLGTDGQTLQAAAVNAWNTAFLAYVAALTPANDALPRIAVCSRALRTAEPVTGFSITPRYGTQRRRLR